MSLPNPIVCAGDNELPDLVDVPDMREAVTGWSRPMTLKIVSLSSGPGGDAVERSRLVETGGFRVATEPRKLNIKDEGEGTRHWKCWMLYVLDDPKIKDGDKIVIHDVPHKVMKSWDRSENGFLVFGLVEDFR